MMKNNSLDDIVKCNIDISSPASSDATFDSILLVVPGPGAAGKKVMDKTTAISQAEELLDYGFTTEDTAYMAAAVAFSQNPAPSGLFICIRKDVSEESAEGPVYEDIKITLARANSEAQFYGIHITDFKDPEDVQGAIEWTESKEKIFGFEYTDIAECPVENFSYFRSFGIYSGKADGYDEDEQPKENGSAALAWMAKCFGYEPGTETWHLKDLAAIVPSSLSTDEKKELEGSCINTFRRYAGSNVTFGGCMLSGEWIDVIRFRDWLRSEMQTNIFNALKVNCKVPYTDRGIGLIEGQMEAALKKGQDIGGIALTEYDDDDKEIPGFTVNVPRAYDLTEAERKSRKLTGCRYMARLAGAVHAVEIRGNLVF